MAKATAISFSFTPHIHSGTPSSQGGGVLLLPLVYYPYITLSFKKWDKLRSCFTFYFLKLGFFIYFFHPRHVGTGFDSEYMYNVVKERKTKENHKI